MNSHQFHNIHHLVIHLFYIAISSYSSQSYLFPQTHINQNYINSQTNNINPMNQFDQQQLNELYSWIDEAPLSRPKRNISRDFSDGVLMAELIQSYYPRSVQVHNYPTSSSLKAKINNWNTLNNKVLSKLDLSIGTDMINDIASAKPFVIQKLLMSLHQKILSDQPSGQRSSHSHRHHEHINEQEIVTEKGLSKLEQLKLIYKLLNDKIQSMEKSIRRKDQHIRDLENIISQHKR